MDAWEEIDNIILCATAIVAVQGKAAKGFSTYTECCIQAMLVLANILRVIATLVVGSFMGYACSLLVQQREWLAKDDGCCKKLFWFCGMGLSPNVAPPKQFEEGVQRRPNSKFAGCFSCGARFWILCMRNEDCVYEQASGGLFAGAGGCVGCF